MFDALIGGAVVLLGAILKDWLSKRKTKSERAEEHRGHEVEAEKARVLLMSDVRKEIELVVGQRDEARGEAARSHREHRECREMVETLSAKIRHLERRIDKLNRALVVAGIDPNGINGDSAEVHGEPV